MLMNLIALTLTCHIIFKLNRKKSFHIKIQDKNYIEFSAYIFVKYTQKQKSRNNIRTWNQDQKLLKTVRHTSVKKMKKYQEN